MTDEELVAEAVRLYSTDKWGRFDATYGLNRVFGVNDEVPIANSRFDQPVRPGTKNPYWEIIRLMPAEWVRYGGPRDGVGPGEGYPSPYGFWMGGDAEDWKAREEAGITRTNLTRRYSWAIPSPGDIAWIWGQLTLRDVLRGESTGVVEVGAGTGYWAWQMQQYGLDVVAYDPFEPEEANVFAQAGPYTKILPGEGTVAAAHGDRALFISWPNYGDPWANKALKAYTGNMLFYAGESAGGCTADDAFYERLYSKWTRVATSPKHFSYWGIHCELTCWKRN